MKIAPIRHIDSDTIRRCDLIGADVDLEEVCHWGWVLWFQKLKPDLVAHYLFLLSEDLDIEVSSFSPVPCLPTGYHASLQEDNKLARVSDLQGDGF